jgi:hypothetical protein
VLTATPPDAHFHRRYPSRAPATPDHPYKNASAFALLCLIGMGVVVQLTSSRVAHDLNELSQSNFPIGAAASALNDNILAVHMRVFRYVSWASNGVSHSVMENLSGEIAIDFGLIQEEFDELATRADLTAAEKAELAALQTKLKDYERTARDVLEVGRLMPRWRQ